MVTAAGVGEPSLQAAGILGSAFQVRILVEALKKYNQGLNVWPE
jgi:hypothetical protein